MGGELTFLEKIMREERALKKGVKEKGKLPIPGNPKLKKKNGKVFVCTWPKEPFASLSLLKSSPELKFQRVNLVQWRVRYV